jgi:hypothetical protein
VFGLSLAIFRAHETNLFIAVSVKGQTIMEPESLANLLKLFRAAQVLFQLLSEYAAEIRPTSEPAGRLPRCAKAAAERAEYFPDRILVPPDSGNQPNGISVLEHTNAEET